MSAETVALIRRAFEALNEGDPEPLVGLIEPGAEWRGVERRRFLWRRTAPV